MFRRKQKPRQNRRKLDYESLETRQVMAANPIAALQETFYAGSASIADGLIDESMREKLGRVDLPLLSENLYDQFQVGQKVRDAFPAKLDPESSLSAGLVEFEDRLRSAGLVVQYVGTTADAKGDLLRVRYYPDTMQLSPRFHIGGNTGFSYFDTGRGEGSLEETEVNIDGGSAQLIVDILYGVDQGPDGQLQFYVSDSSGLRIEQFSLSGQVTGAMAIRSLANVAVDGWLDASLSAGISFADNDSDLASGVRGDIDGHVGLTNVELVAHMPVIGDIEWGGTFDVEFKDGEIKDKKDGPNEVTEEFAMRVLRQAAGGLFSVVKDLPILGGIQNSLNSKLKRIPVNLYERLDIKNKLGWLLDVPNHSFADDKLLAQIQDALPEEVKLLPGQDLTVQNAQRVIGNLIKGERVDLLKFEKPYEHSWATTTKLFDVTLPAGPFLVNFELDIEPYAGFHAFVGLGIDTTGFYIDPRTGFGIHGGLWTNLSGGVSFLGVLGVKSTLGIGARINAGVGFNDPDPNDGRIYLDELYDGSVRENFLESMQFHIGGELRGHVVVKITTPWPLPNVTLVNEEFTIGAFDDSVNEDDQLAKSRRRFALATNKPLDLESMVRPEGDGTRVLVLTGNDDQRDAMRLSGSGERVHVTWFGKGVGEVTNIHRVEFDGLGGHDSLEVDPSFNVRVDADGGAGDDVLIGGSGDDTLNGGEGDDQLRGQGGNDVLKGGEGTDELEGGAGLDKLDGEGGRDILLGGSGDDELDGGSEGDLLNGDEGNDHLIGGTGNFADLLEGGHGKDTLEAGEGDDVLVGGQGNDTLHGQAGNDQLDGGTEVDLLLGGQGNDFLQGGDGADTVFGNAGDDTLQGGAGLDVLYGDDDVDREQGRDRFEIDFKTNDESVVDEIHGGLDRDYIVVIGTNPAEWQDDKGVTHSQSGNDEIYLSQVAGQIDTYEASWRERGSNEPLRSVRFTVPGDVDAVVVNAYGGDDFVEVKPATYAKTYIEGGAGNDTLFGGDSDDVIRGGIGNDAIHGRGGDDELYGEQDRDKLFGGAGRDALHGGQEDDYINGDEGSDVSYGEEGSDRIEAGGGFDGDVMYGDDDKSGAAFSDTLIGGDGPDVMFGGRGNDHLEGRGGTDIVLGEDGKDVLIGGEGRDFLFGGNDSDMLYARSEDLSAELLVPTNDTGDRLTTIYARLLDLEAAATHRRHRLEAEKLAIDLSDGTEDNKLGEATPDGLARLQDVYAESQRELAALRNDSTSDEAQTFAIDEVMARLQAIDELDGELDSIVRGMESFQAEHLRGSMDELIDEIALVQDELAMINLMQIDVLPKQTILTDVVLGEAGDDYLWGSRYLDKLVGGSDNDTIYHSAGDDLVQGGQGAQDTYVVQGTEGNDYVDFEFEATQDKDRARLYVIYKDINGNELARIVLDHTGIERFEVQALGGNDHLKLTGLKENVPGTFVLTAGAGDDVIRAESYEGNTELSDGTGTDEIHLGKAQDKIHLEPDDADDTLFFIEGGGLGDEISGIVDPTCRGRDRVVFAARSGDKIRVDAEGLVVNGVLLRVDFSTIPFLQIVTGGNPVEISRGSNTSQVILRDDQILDSDLPREYHDPAGQRWVIHVAGGTMFAVDSQGIQYELGLPGHNQVLFNGVAGRLVTDVDRYRIEFDGAPDWHHLFVSTRTDAVASGLINGVFDHMVSGDFDGDGRDDVMFHVISTGLTRWFFGRSDGSFDYREERIGAGQVNGDFDNVVVGHFNDDEYADLLFHDKESGLNRWFFGRDDRTFQFHQNLIDVRSINGEFNHVVVGDFNGDRLDDVLFHASLSGNNRWFLARPGEAFDSWGVNRIDVRAINTMFDHVVAGDFNGDGRDDLMFHDTASGENRWFYTRTDGQFEFLRNPIDTWAVNSVFDCVTVADFDNDGCDDVLFYSSTDGRTRFGFGVSGHNRVDWDAQFRIIPDLVNRMDRVVTGDFDGDGYVDAFFSDYGSGRNVLADLQGVMWR